MGTVGTTVGIRGWGFATTGMTVTMVKHEHQGSFPELNACAARDAGNVIRGSKCTPK